MMTNVKLIIKVMDGSSISVVVDSKGLPSAFLSDTNYDINFLLVAIAEQYQILESYIKPKLTYFGTDDGYPCVYYTIHFPKEFLDEKTISKLCNNFEQLSEQDRIAIRQSFSILPY